VPEASLTPAAAAPPFPLKSRQPREQRLPSPASHGRSAASDCASFPIPAFVPACCSYLCGFSLCFVPACCSAVRSPASALSAGEPSITLRPARPRSHTQSHWASVSEDGPVADGRRAAQHRGQHRGDARRACVARSSLPPVISRRAVYHRDQCECLVRAGRTLVPVNARGLQARGLQARGLQARAFRREEQRRLRALLRGLGAAADEPRAWRRRIASGRRRRRRRGGAGGPALARRGREARAGVAAHRRGWRAAFHAPSRCR
jgi:hypothetical protein